MDNNFNSDKQIYLVQSISDDGTSFNRIMNQYELCNYMNMLDCYPEELVAIWDITIPGKVRKCTYKGWQPNCLIEVVREDDDKLVISLYGEEH